MQLIAVVAVALIFDMMNGFHDGCNAVSTVIYTGALKPRFAIGLSAIFNFIGPLVMGVAVAKTIGGIIQAGDATRAPRHRCPVWRLVWEVLTWWWALPVSSSHALVGGLARRRAGGPRAGRHQLAQAHSRLRVAVRLAVPRDRHRLHLHASQPALLRQECIEHGQGRPLLQAHADPFLELGVVQPRLQRRHEGHGDHRHLPGGRAGQSVTDYAKAHGRTIPLWVILSCAAAMAVGTFLSVKSFRLIRTLGEKITKLHPINGFSAESRRGDRSSSSPRSSDCPSPPLTSSPRRSPVPVWRAIWAG